MSETLLVGSLLAMVGGFLDVYTYMIRGGVFANAQTGNIVLLGIQLAEGNIKKTIGYLIPIIAFIVGIIVAEIIKNKYKSRNHVHWRQIVVLVEILTLLSVAFIPETQNMVVNAMISFVCSLQVESFRNKVMEYTEIEIIDEEAKRRFSQKHKIKPNNKVRKGAGFKQSITRISIGGGRKSKMRTVDIVGALSNLEHRSSQDIGTIDIRESLTYVEVLNGKGKHVIEQLQTRPIKGKVRKVRATK